MGIFNMAWIDELKKENEELKKKNEELQRLLTKVESDLGALIKTIESKPSDCIPGEYCKACEFGKNHYYWYHGYRNNHDAVFTGYICEKGESCRHFTQKEVKND